MEKDLMSRLACGLPGEELERALEEARGRGPAWAAVVERAQKAVDTLNSAVGDLSVLNERRGDEPEPRSVA